MSAAVLSRERNSVGGEWAAATDGATMDVLDPATGDVITQVPRGGAAEADAAVAAAVAARSARRRTACKERADALLALADEDEALRWANDVEYGRWASVGATVAGRALRVAGELAFSTVWINDLPLTSEMRRAGASAPAPAATRRSTRSTSTPSSST